MEVFQCYACPPDKACGFDGQSLDCSRDECHHPFEIDEARRIAACVNAFNGVATEDIEAKYGAVVVVKQPDFGSGPGDHLMNSVLNRTIDDYFGGSFHGVRKQNDLLRRMDIASKQSARDVLLDAPPNTSWIITR